MIQKKYGCDPRKGLESISQGQLPNLQAAPLHRYHVGYGSVDLVPAEVCCSTTRRPVPCCLLCWALGVGLAHYISSSNGSYAKGCWEAQGKPGGLQPKHWANAFFFTKMTRFNRIFKVCKINHFLNDFIIKNVCFFSYCHVELQGSPRRNGKKTWVDVAKMATRAFG